MREIKFRAWLRDTGIMLNVYVLDQTGNAGRGTHFPKSKGCSEHGAQFVFNIDDADLMQATGFQDKNGVDTYEGDIFRVEEQESKTCDQCDGCGWYEGGPAIQTQCETCLGTGKIEESEKHFYLIITWVREWGMFCTLTTEEYHTYNREGLKVLDEPMFWTYTMEDTDSRKYFLCGNIYQHPELLKVKL